VYPHDRAPEVSNTNIPMNGPGELVVLPAPAPCDATRPSGIRLGVSQGKFPRAVPTDIIFARTFFRMPCSIFAKVTRIGEFCQVDRGPDALSRQEVPIAPLQRSRNQVLKRPLRADTVEKVAH
jgi:hypothetical protein